MNINMYYVKLKGLYFELKDTFAHSFDDEHCPLSPLLDLAPLYSWRQDIDANLGLWTSNL